MAIFENPVNNYRVEVNSFGPFLWCLLFGSFYFLAKGNFKHAILSLIVALITVGISWIIYPFFAPSIIRNMWLEKGYRQVG